MLSSGVAYVAVLRAEAQERIQRKNIQLTREYLELARLRLEVGVANASELYRWQVTLADNQRRRRRCARDRRANEDRAQPSAQSSVRAADRTARSSARRGGPRAAPEDPIAKYMSDPWSFEHLRDFMVREGLRNSPEARQIEARKAAQHRIKEGRTRELWLPDFFVEGGIQHDFWVDGEGSDSAAATAALGIPELNKFAWDVGALRCDSAFTRWLGRRGDARAARSRRAARRRVRARRAVHRHRRAHRALQRRAALASVS